MENDSSSSTNTVLIVIILVILVGFGVWWFTTHNAAPAEPSGTNVNVTVPGSTTSTTPAPKY